MPALPARQASPEARGDSGPGFIVRFPIQDFPSRPTIGIQFLSSKGETQSELCYWALWDFKLSSLPLRPIYLTWNISILL